MLEIFRRKFLFSSVIASAVVTACGASAYENIGVASYVRNNVNGVLPSRTALINVGENIVRDEIVKTDPGSAAKVVFTDNTNLSIGPSSVVKLDKFVFSGESNYQKATINLAKGALRFATGSSDKRAYEIKSPVATIGVRGTIFELSYSGTGKKEKIRDDENCEIADLPHHKGPPEPGEETTPYNKKCKVKCADVGAGQSVKIEGKEGESTLNVIEGVVHICSTHAPQATTPNQLIECGGPMCTQEQFAGGLPVENLLIPALATTAIGAGIGAGASGHTPTPPPGAFNPGNPASSDGTPGTTPPGL